MSKNTIRIPGHMIYAGRSWRLQLQTDGGLQEDDQFRCQLRRRIGDNKVLAEPTIELDETILVFSLSAAQTKSLSAGNIEGDVWLVRDGIEASQPLIDKIEIRVIGTYTEPVR